MLAKRFPNVRFNVTNLKPIENVTITLRVCWEGTCVQQHILDVMLRILSNISKAMLTDTSVYFWLKLNCKIIWGFEENQ